MINGKIVEESKKMMEDDKKLRELFDKKIQLETDLVNFLSRLIKIQEDKAIPSTYANTITLVTKYLKF